MIAEYRLSLDAFMLSVNLYIFLPYPYPIDFASSAWSNEVKAFLKNKKRAKAVVENQVMSQLRSAPSALEHPNEVSSSLLASNIPCLV